MMDRSTITMLEQVIRLAKGIIRALEEWLTEQKKKHAASTT